MYARVVAELAAAPAAAVADRHTTDRTVNEVLAAFWTHAQSHYRHPDGRPTSELGGYKLALRSVKALYGHESADRFGPLALKAVRQALVARGGSRKVVNQHVGRVKRVFKWAVGEELVPAAVYQGLTAVAGLQAGRTAAPEPPVPPVDAAVIEATLPYLTRHVRGIVRFMRLTGCRPGEACLLRRGDLDTTGPVWVYRPQHHKLAYRGKWRAVMVGPAAQAVLAEFPTAGPDEFVFSPARERAERFAARRAARRTEVQPSQACRAKANPKRAPGACYPAHAVATAVRKAAARAGVPHWHPNQLRHTFATAVRREFGLEAAQVLLGHARADTTQIYADRDLALAERVAAAVG